MSNKTKGFRKGTKSWSTQKVSSRSEALNDEMDRDYETEGASQNKNPAITVGSGSKNNYESPSLRWDDE